jgi:transcription initiation factor IIE alpha subunit
MQELIDTILEDLYTEISHAEARNDHRAVDVLRMVINRIEAREYEYSQMFEGRVDSSSPGLWCWQP